MSTVKTKKVQLGTDATASNNFTLYQPATPDGTLRVGVGNADSPTEVGQFNANGYKPAEPVAFSAIPSSSTSVTNATFTKISYGTEEFDTNLNYDTSTNRFTPTVAGYYQVNASINYVAATPAGTNALLAIYKNGSWFKSSSGGNIPYFNIASLIYLNGTTDYIEIYAHQSSGSTLTTTAAGQYQFSAILISQA